MESSSLAGVHKVVVLSAALFSPACWLQSDVADSSAAGLDLPLPGPVFRLDGGLSLPALPSWLSAGRTWLINL